MTTRLTFPASMFSVVCQRCGSTMRKNADSCPNCGADRNAASAQPRQAAAPQERPRVNMFEQTLSKPLPSMSTSATASAAASVGAGASASGALPEEPATERGWPAGWDPKRASERIAQKAAEHRAKRLEESARSAYANTGRDPDALPGSESWSKRKTVIAGVCSVVLALGAAAYLQYGDSNDDDASPSADHSVSGAIDSRFSSLVPGTAPNVNPNVATGAGNASADARASVSGDTLRSVRLALDQHDLTLARARLKTVPASLQTRPDYDSMKEELAKRELQRDAALQLARACERTSAWSCVQQNAGEALAIDGGNGESQAMLERVISHAGWMVATPAGAKKPLPSAVTAAAPAPAAPASVVAANVGKPATTANVEVATPPVKTVTIAPKNVVERHAAQRGTAAAARRDAIDEARDASTDSRAEKIARAQAATNAITAATVGPAATANVAPANAPATSAVELPAAKMFAPSAATATVAPATSGNALPAARTTAATTAPAVPSSTTPAPSAVAGTAAPSVAVQTPAPVTTTATRTAPANAAPPPGTSRTAPAAVAANTRPAPQTGATRNTASTGLYDASSANHANASDEMYVAPQNRGATATGGGASNNGMYDATSNRGGTSNGMYVAPSASGAAPHASTSSTATGATPVAVRNTTPQAQLAAAPAISPPAASPRAAASFGASNVSAHMDADKTEELERAIKQYGWTSGGGASKSAP
ncbi:MULTISPECIES: zinc ribbon domain-containing protein [unclassified Caballeronia]|uniref:zinc ribbon domain-containing protein n=1 Tax=unclassified Caballeronia TaxID=2646786 RepID=UPI0028605D21|nr:MULTISPECIES: zinc ribbon domain-containing protein [unclassified Caballeronia]MDR5775322.1 zinc ribbon domain-containing protein [Caballeronia sp. LZ002]MDR5850760.1 zinc ribbon domain-containing protein [Caballeronia sp. LZ003]